MATSAASAGVAAPDGASGVSDTLLDDYMVTAEDRQALRRHVENSVVLRLQQAALRKEAEEKEPPRKMFDLLDIAPMVKGGMQVLVQDEFTNCFQPSKSHPWNWNIYLLPMWIFGIFVRYIILLPFRLTVVVIGTFICIPIFSFIWLSNRDEKTKMSRLRKLTQFYCSMWVACWSGVIRYHGIKPRKRPNQVFVSNHTTIYDIFILQQHMTYAIIGQKHTGIMGWFQDYPLACLGCIWFERKYVNDRVYLQRRLKEHLGNSEANPLLIFPEGTCVNNEYCIMFKKGAFELGATVYPIAIKYNKIFSDPFWDSKSQTIMRHTVNIMSSWAVVCDVWYLEPQTMRHGESSMDFANRIKAMIAKKAGLVNVEWDGYLKYFQPSPRFLEERQRTFAGQLNKIMRGRCTVPAAAALRRSASMTRLGLSRRHGPLGRRTRPKLSKPIVPAIPAAVQAVAEAAAVAAAEQAQLVPPYFGHVVDDSGSEETVSGEESSSDIPAVVLTDPEQASCSCSGEEEHLAFTAAPEASSENTRAPAAEGASDSAASIVMRRHRVNPRSVRGCAH
eukprot:TRINITY_DN9559_c0_g1_i1.p1 TRINITY_DN9559_c0_g1~~TRINITY_DN9559_c0_g1_i1.p1  ORF type:complete len:560 (-),score=149.41 TRINITY_DN9559_c0_g1_i1:85-1764(-)